jgi:hypothetical protein
MEQQLKRAPVERDYTCVPTAQLAALFHEYRDRTDSLADIAERAELDVRDLKKIVNLGKYRTTNLALADRILNAIGQNLTSLVHAEVLVVIPLPGRDNAAKMARDEWYTDGRGLPGGSPAPGPPERKRRIDELVALRRSVLER